MTSHSAAGGRKVHFPSDPNLLEKEGAVEAAPASDVPEVVASAADDKGVGMSSIVCVLFVNFLANIVFSIVLPSVWPYLQAVSQCCMFVSN
jgi:hypothetical protein